MRESVCVRERQSEIDMKTKVVQHVPRESECECGKQMEYVINVLQFIIVASCDVIGHHVTSLGIMGCHMTSCRLAAKFGPMWTSASFELGSRHVQHQLVSGH